MNIYVVYAIHADQCGLVIVNEWVAVVCDFDAPFICQWLGLSVQKSFLRFYSNCDVCAKFIFRLLVFFFFLLLFIFLDHSVFTDVRCSGYGWRQCQFQYGVMMGVLFIQFLFSNLYISYENRIEQKKKKKEYYEDMYPPIRTCHIACRIRWWFCQVVRAMLVLIVSICIRLTSNRRRFFLPTVRRFADFASIQPHNINNNSSGGSCSEIPICNCIW